MPHKGKTSHGLRAGFLFVVLLVLAGPPSTSAALKLRLPQPPLSRLVPPWRIVGRLLSPFEKGKKEASPSPEPHPALRCRDLPLKEGLLKQKEKELMFTGERLTVMCVGESGVGKSSLISNIFTVPVKPSKVARTEKIHEQVLHMQCEGIPLQITFIDTPGYGDDLALSQNFKEIAQYIDTRFERALKREALYGRYDEVTKGQFDHPVDAVLYFIAPHRFKGVDIQFLRQIAGRASIIPILAKADTMTTQELTEFRSVVVNKLAENGIGYYRGPFAIISAPYHNTSSDQERGGRLYPWGMAESENESHSDLPALRRCLVTEGLCDLRKSGFAYYSQYRSRKLAWKRGWKGLLRNTFNFVISHITAAVIWSLRPKALKDAEQRAIDMVKEAPAIGAEKLGKAAAGKLSKVAVESLGKTATGRLGNAAKQPLWRRWCP